MADQHPDSETLQAFREHRLSGSVVAEVASHIGGCARCAKVEPAAARTAFDALVEDAHLSDEEMDVLVDGGSDDPRIALHVKTCAMCRAEVDDLRSFDIKLSPPRPWQRWGIAAAIMFAVLALSAVALFFRQADPAVIPSVVEGSGGAGGATSAPPAQPDPSTDARDDSVVASLADGDRRIALLEDGTVAGVEVQSPRDADDARAVLSGRSIVIPTFVAAMPGAVRGAAADARPPRAIAPFRSAVLESRPRFSWTPVPGAKSHRVAVFDADYEEIARSEALQTTSWTPSQPLPAGVDLSWHVVAETDAGEVSSAGSNRGEAVFRVLTPKEAAEVDLGEAHYRDSHLLRGLLYSRHGLLHAAEREFRILREQNPGSPIARALIDSVAR